MSSESPNPTSKGTASGLGVSAYDRTAALLVALLIMVGVFVSMLVVIWITSRVFTTQQAVPVEFIEELSGGDAALGSARDLEEPGLDRVIQGDFHLATSMSGPHIHAEMFHRVFLTLPARDFYSSISSE